jgi:hypothetical protein
MGIVLLELIRERKCNDRQTGIVAGGVFTFLVLRLAFLVDEVSLLAVDVADASVPASGLQSATEQTGIGESVLHDALEARESKMNEVVVLRNDLSSRSREVEGVGLFGSTEVVQLEDQVLGKIAFVSPDDPANAGIDQTKLVTGSYVICQVVDAVTRTKLNTHC